MDNTKQDVLSRYGLDEVDLSENRTASAPVLERGLANLKAYGFSLEEIRALVRKHPALLGYTAERTNALLANLEVHGFSRDEIRAMVRKQPSLLICSAKRTNQGLAAMRLVGLDRPEHADLLVFAPSLLRARIAFLQVRGFEATASKLKSTNTRFALAYGLDRAEVMKWDPLRDRNETAPTE